VYRNSRVTSICLVVNSCTRRDLQSCEDVQGGGKEYALRSSRICRYLSICIYICVWFLVIGHVIVDIYAVMLQIAYRPW